MWSLSHWTSREKSLRALLLSKLLSLGLGFPTFIMKVIEGLDGLLVMLSSPWCWYNTWSLLSCLGCPGLSCSPSPTPPPDPPSAPQNGAECCVHVQRQVSGPSAFLSSWAGSSDILCLLFLPPPTPALSSLFIPPYQAFSNFQISGGGERKRLVTLQVSMEEQTPRTDKQTPARFYDLSLGMGFPAIKCLLT